MSPMRIPKKNRCGAVSDTSDGFVCLYFLVLFLLCSSLIAVLIGTVKDRTKTAINLQRTNELLAQESAVLHFIKCGLRNEQLTDGAFEESGVSFTVNRHGTRIDAVIRSPIPEVLQISTEEETHVYDYEVVRSEIPA